MALWAAGAAAPITPPTPVVLAGFGARKGRVDRVHDDLEVSALVLRDDERTLCLLVFDLLLLGPKESAAIRAGVAHELGIDPLDVLTSCTHTHAGPSPNPATRRLGWVVPDGFVGILVAAAAGAAVEAASALEPVTVVAATGPLDPGLSVNRRGLPYAPTAGVVGLVGEDGSAVVTIGSLAVHPVSLGTEWRAVSTDWVGPCRRRIADARGGFALVVSGALGDVNPAEDPHEAGRPEEPSAALTEALGERLADVVLALADDAEPVEAGRLEVWRRTLAPRTGVRIPTVLQVSAGRREQVELVEWGLGPLRFVSVPGEAFHALGKAIEATRPGPTVLVGLSPGWQGYLPVPFRKGYEEAMSFGKGFVAEVAAALEQPPGSADAR